MIGAGEEWEWKPSPKLSDIEELAWELYCKNTWTAVAVDYWSQLSDGEQVYWLELARRGA